MTEPLFWLGLSILLVAVCLAALLAAAIPALLELARAARSIEKLADTLNRELPPTLEAIRLTGLEISDLTDDISEGVQSAGSVAKQVNQGLSGAGRQVKEAKVTTRSVVAGVKAAWRSWTRPAERRRDSRAETLRDRRGSGRAERSGPRERFSTTERLMVDYRATYREYEEENLSEEHLNSGETQLTSPPEQLGDHLSVPESVEGEEAPEGYPKPDQS